MIYDEENIKKRTMQPTRVNYNFLVRIFEINAKSSY